jgi:UDP-N-acetylmuramyl pentapeptide phosphotransferase/UDP-N-acetylglucosamine-1-phosphate transferase
MLVPPWILLGLTIIMVIGLIDDVTGISPRVKVGGQLLAAAALAYGDIGVKVAAGVLTPDARPAAQQPRPVLHQLCQASSRSSGR